MMDATKILHAEFIDILFDGRNKEYGAYELRRAYNKRLYTAIAVMLGICLVLFMSSQKQRAAAVVSVERTDVHLMAVEQPKPEVVIPPVAPMAKPIAMTAFTPIVIVQDNQVNEDDAPPEMDALDETKIGTINTDGVKDEGIEAPPVETAGTGNAFAPQTDKQDYDSIFMKVENPAQFPGGVEAWRRYLERNLHYPDGAQNNGTQGVVRVQFVVDVEGVISNVVALDDPGDGLAYEAVRIISKGPKWIPAEQNNRKVNYRHVQAITFRME